PELALVVRADVTHFATPEAAVAPELDACVRDGSTISGADDLADERIARVELELDLLLAVRLVEDDVGRTTRDEAFRLGAHRVDPFAQRVDGEATIQTALHRRGGEDDVHGLARFRLLATGRFL